MILIAHDEQLFTLDTRVDTAESNIVALTAFDTSLRTQLVSEKVLFNKASTYNTPFTGSFNELRDLPDLGGYTWTDYLGWSLDAAGILFDAAGGWAALTNWLGFSSAVP